MCIEASWLVENGIVTKWQYEKLSSRKQINVVRRGCRNTPALVEFDSIPRRFRELIINKYGNPNEVSAVSHFEKHIKADERALEYFSNYQLENGDTLPLEKQLEYYNNAIILNTIHEILNNRKALRRALGGQTTGLWASVANTVLKLNTSTYPHTLPQNIRRMQEKYKTYVQEGYQSLIHKSFGNSFARVVNAKLERLILSIYCMSNKPYSKWVHEDYLQFIAGVLDIVDMETGELFDRQDYFDTKKGNYIMISESTCRNIINNPKNRAIVDAVRMGRHRYSGNIRPHFNRHSAKYSLSKISLDDRDLPRKLHDGNRVKAYYAYDVASGILLGASYSLSKNTDLFINCVRDMFRNINKGGWGMPAEVEVEHHIVGQFKDDLMKAGVVFPFVRFCAPGNSQEKHAEHFNRQKKYGYEKRYQDGIGRFYLKSEANQTGGERIYDEKSNKYIIRERTYSFEELVADDKTTIEAYNNGLHRDQKTYPGKTRMQVFLENINPNLAEINPAVLARYIGESRNTSIVRNMYCTVNYRKYMLPTPDILEKLLPNNYEVVAYFLPDTDEIYIYQNDKYLCECKVMQTFTTSQAETTDADVEARKIQAKYINQFDMLVKQGKSELAKVKHISIPVNLEDIEAQEVETKEHDKNEYDYELMTDMDYWSELALKNL